MKRIALLFFALLFVGGALPASADWGVDVSPYGGEDNPVGSLRWLPRNANEKPTADGLFRLVMVYDHSLSDAGQEVPLKAQGTFALKVLTSSHNLRALDHSPSVFDLDDELERRNMPRTGAMALYGDTRDGECSKAGTTAFSQAYSTTRSFFHPGPDPYEPANAPGTCERLTSSVAQTDDEGNVLGYQTTVTNHVPGFWVDVEWPSVDNTGSQDGSGYNAAEIWYVAAYDSTGDPAGLASLDSAGSSTSIGAPGDYTYTYSFTAIPGGVGWPCQGTQSGIQSLPGSWQEVKVPVPDGATKMTFLLFPKTDWDLTVFNPDGLRRHSGLSGGLSETVMAPGPAPNAGTTDRNYKTLVPGEYRMLACNFSGEPGEVMGAVIIET